MCSGITVSQGKYLPWNPYIVDMLSCGLIIAIQYVSRYIRNKMHACHRQLASRRAASLTSVYVRTVYFPQWMECLSCTVNIISADGSGHYVARTPAAMVLTHSAGMYRRLGSSLITIVLDYFLVFLTFSVYVYISVFCVHK